MNARHYDDAMLPPKEVLASSRKGRRGVYMAALIIILVAFGLEWDHRCGSDPELGDEWISRKDLLYSEALHAAADAIASGEMATARHKLEVARRMADSCLAVDILNGFLPCVPEFCDDNFQYVHAVGATADGTPTVVAISTGGTAAVWPTQTKIDGVLAVYPDQSGRVFGVLTSDRAENAALRLPGDPWSDAGAHEWISESRGEGYRLAMYAVATASPRAAVALACDPAHVSFSATSEYVCVVSFSGDIYVYEVSGGRLVAQIGDGRGVIDGRAIGVSRPFGLPGGPVRVSTDGTTVAYVAGDNAAYRITVVCDDGGEASELNVDTVKHANTRFLDAFFRDDGHVEILANHGIMTWTASGLLDSTLDVGTEPVIGVIPNASRTAEVTWIGLVGEETIRVVDVGRQNGVIASAVMERLPWLAAENRLVIPRFVPGTERLVMLGVQVRPDPAAGGEHAPRAQGGMGRHSDETRVSVREIETKDPRPYVVECRSTPSWCLDASGKYLYYTDEASPLKRLNLANGLTDIVDPREPGRLLLPHRAPDGVSIIDHAQDRVAWEFSALTQFDVSRNGNMSHFTLRSPARRAVGRVSPNGEYFASMSNRGWLEVWSSRSQRKLLERQLQRAPACVDELVSRRGCEIHFTANSNRLAVRYDGVFSVFDCGSWKPVGMVNVPWSILNDSLSASADGSVYALVIWGHPGKTFMDDQEIRKLWGEMDYLGEMRRADEDHQTFVLLVRPDSRTGQQTEILSLQSDMDEPTYAALTGDGAYLLLAVGSRLEIYRTNNLLRLTRLETGMVGPVVVSEDNRWLVYSWDRHLFVVPLFGQQAETSRGVLTPLRKLGTSAGGNGFNALP